MNLYSTGHSNTIQTAKSAICNLWNASVYEQNADEYVIKNVGWNFEIAPNQSVTYGYTLNGNDLALPDSFEIYSKRVDKTEGYDVQYNITKSWDTGVEGNIVITNNSDAPIEAWTLSFDSNFTINNLWNGRVLENNETSYKIAAEMWTNPVQPNGSMTIGFVGSKAADVEALLSNFRLTEVIIGEGTPVTPIDPPEEKIEITANAEYNEETDNVTVSWITNNPDGTFDILMSADGENFTSVGTVENVSEFVYTPATDFDAYHFKVVQTVGEQTAESNVVSVVKSAEDIAISAEAVFDEESGSIAVKWTTNKPNGTFDVLMSFDGESFTSVGTVENAAEFVYTPDEFDTLYLKVKQTAGAKTAESNVVSVVYTVDWSDKTDTDNDGLPDVYEKQYFETDPENADTDGDGLPDGYEVYCLGTNPKKADSDDNGVPDSDEDFDKDGLNNLREYELGTDPNNADSDSDGLSDSDEVNTYNTDPLKYDTDADGISDGDEIALGLDPNSASTDGVPDSERTFVQHIGADSENLAAVNTEENPFKVSVDITAAGVAEHNLYADESGYSAFVSNDAILGVTPEFFYTEGLKVENITINFDIQEEFVSNTNGKYMDVSEEFVGIKRLNVFKYFEDINMLLPIETFHDVESNKVYAKVDEMGTYCLIDMEIWFENIGITPQNPQMQTMSLSLDEATEVKTSNGDSLDVIFVVYTNSTFLNYIKAELISAAEEIFNEAEKQNISARIHYVAWTGNIYVNPNTGTYYAENIDDATKMINNTTVINTAALEPTVYMLTKAITGIRGDLQNNLQEKSKQYCFIVDGGCNPACTTTHGGIEALKETGMDFSFVYAPGNQNVTNYSALSSNNSIHQMVVGNGRLAFWEFVFEHVMSVEEEQIIIKSNDFERLPDDFGEISMTSTQDYDGDGLVDVDEIDFERMSMYSANTYSMGRSSFTLPKLSSLMEISSTGYIFVGIDRYLEYVDNADKITIIMVESDPTKSDSDFDLIDDNADVNPQSNILTGNLITHPVKGREYQCDVKLNVDYRQFWKDNTIYNKNMSVWGSIMSTLAYEEETAKISFDHAEYGEGNIKKLYELWGFNYDNVKLCEYPEYHDDDISEMTIGNKKVTYNGEEKELIFVSIRGTDSTIEEWSSNFDVGSNTDAYISTLSQAEQEGWINRNNHKGFDVTANRIYKEIENYVNSEVDGDTKPVIFIVGHSRGAAIANILGTMYENDDEYIPFTYCYATPNTTTDTNYRQYKTIFNVVNEDDLVPCLPLNSWDFHRYGTTYSVSVKETYEKTILISSARNSWEEMFGEDYNYNNNLKSTIKSLDGIANDRDELYIYPDSSDIIYRYSNIICDDIDKEVSKRIEKYGSRIGKYCEVSAESKYKPINGTLEPEVETFDIVVKQSPAFLMMVIADMASSKCRDDISREVVEYSKKGVNEDTLFGINVGFYVAEKYYDAKIKFCLSAADSASPLANTLNIGGMVNAHMPATYYFITVDTKNSLKAISNH